MTSPEDHAQKNPQCARRGEIDIQSDAGRRERKQRQDQIGAPGRDRALDAIGRRQQPLAGGGEIAARPFPASAPLDRHDRRRLASFSRMFERGERGRGLRQQAARLPASVASAERRPEATPASARMHAGRVQAEPDRDRDHRIGPRRIDASAVQREHHRDGRDGPRSARRARNCADRRPPAPAPKGCRRPRRRRRRRRADWAERDLPTARGRPAQRRCRLRSARTSRTRSLPPIEQQIDQRRDDRRRRPPR